MALLGFVPRFLSLLPLLQQVTSFQGYSKPFGVREHTAGTREDRSTNGSLVVSGFEPWPPVWQAIHCIMTLGPENFFILWTYPEMRNACSTDHLIWFYHWGLVNLLTILTNLIYTLICQQAINVNDSDPASINVWKVLTSFRESIDMGHNWLHMKIF